MKLWKKVLVLIWAAVIVGLFIGWGIASAADLQVSWNANTETDLAGYKVYYAQPGDPGWSIADGTASYTLGTLPNMSGLVTSSTMTLTDVAPGPYAVAVTALDTTGNESVLSSVVTALVVEPAQVIVVPPIDLPPGAPVQVIINLVTE